MKNKRFQLDRRTFLRGTGSCISLPLLEAMIPTSLLAQSAETPKRAAFFFVPNGMDMASFLPTSEGAGYTLPFTLEPLAQLKNDILVISGLSNPIAGVDGAGDHARSAGTFLTNVRINKSSSDIKAGVSLDQKAAALIGAKTPFKSLEVGCEGGGSAGGCDSGYSCAYSRNISWISATTPNPKEINPRILFERMYGVVGNGDNSTPVPRRDLYKKSILDYVINDTQKLSARLGGSDKEKLEEYLTRLREVEQRIQTQETTAGTCSLPTKPNGIPGTYDEHARLMMDLMALAFQCDLTRIITFMFANEGSNFNFPFIGINEGHHDLSHHGGSADRKKKLATINRWQISQYAYFLSKLKSMSEAGGSVLDNSLIMFGAGIDDGNAHTHNNLPIVLAGKGGKNLATGRHIRRQGPLANLYVAMMQTLGINIAQHGDSTGPLTF